MNRFLRVYVLGLVFVSLSTAPMGVLLLLGGWLWTQGAVLTVVSVALPPVGIPARLCLSAADLCIRPIAWAYRRYDQTAFPEGEVSANLSRPEMSTAVDTEATEMA